MEQSIEKSKIDDMHAELSDTIDMLYKMSKQVAMISDRVQTLEEKIVLHAMTHKSLIDSLDNVNERLEVIDDFLEELSNE